MEPPLLEVLTQSQALTTEMPRKVSLLEEGHPMEALIWFALSVLFLGIIIGFLCWAVQTAPFIPETFKQVAVWVLMVIGVLMLLFLTFDMLHGGHALIH